MQIFVWRAWTAVDRTTSLGGNAMVAPIDSLPWYTVSGHLSVSDAVLVCSTLFLGVVALVTPTFADFIRRPKTPSQLRRPPRE